MSILAQSPSIRGRSPGRIMSRRIVRDIMPKKQPTMTIEQYLRTSFDGADREYLDGRIVERNMGEWSHARVQVRLASLLEPQESDLGIQVVVEIRMRTAQTRVRIPDVGVWLSDFVPEPVPGVPPFLAIEVVSPKDRPRRMQEKVEEYLAWGVRWVWRIDPYAREAFVYTSETPGGKLVTDVLRTDDPRIEISLADAFATLPAPGTVDQPAVRPKRARSR